MFDIKPIKTENDPTKRSLFDNNSIYSYGSKVIKEPIKFLFNKK